ncbi:MAG: thioredoxin family protein, partial [Rubripirellula sp.]
MVSTFLRSLALCLTLGVATQCRLHANESADASSDDTKNLSLPKGIADFSLPTVDGNTVSLSKDPSIKLTVVCFLGTECPLAKLYGPRLQQLADTYSKQGVQFVGINSNVQDSMEELQKYGKDFGISFPLAKDYDRTSALNFGATRTPEVFVLDRSGQIRYQGRIDDQYEPGIVKPKSSQFDLRNAIDDLVSGKTVKQPRTTAVGCLIALPRTATANSEVTFCNQVIRVLRRNCIECHREGEIGPFALEDYDEVVGWADMSLEVIEQGRMPPWHAESDVSVFSNARN